MPRLLYTDTLPPEPTFAVTAFGIVHPGLQLRLDGVIVRHALRVTAVGVPLFVVLGPVLERWEAVGPGVFAVFALGSFADFSGLPRRRATRYLTCGAVALLMIPLGTLAGRTMAGVVIVTGLVVFTTFYVGALGGPWFSARFPVVIAFLYAAAAPEPGALGERMVGWAAGTVLIALAALVLWPLRPRHTARVLAGQASRLTAAALQAQAAGREAPDVELRSVVDRLRARSTAVDLHPGAVARDERLVSEIVHLVERTVAVVLTMPIRVAGADDRELVDRADRALGRVADVLDPPTGTSRPDHEPAPIGDELEAALLAVPATGGREADATAAVAAALDDASVRFVARIVVVLARLTEGFLRVLAGSPLPPEPDRGDGPWPTLRSQFTLRSLWCREAVRAAVALMVSMAVVAAGAGSGHGFWVALGTFSVLRADLSTIGRSAVSAIIGTAIGFAVGSGLVLVGERQEWVLWVFLPITMFLASWTGRFRPEVTSAALTTFLVAMYALADPDGLATAEARLATVVIGAGVTLVVGALLWPKVGSVPGAALAQVVATARARLGEAVTSTTAWATGPAGDRPVPRGPGPTAPGTSLPVVTELDRVLDTLASSAPATLDAGIRQQILATVDVAVAMHDLVAERDDWVGGPGAAGSLRTDAALARALAADAVAADAALHDLVDRLRGVAGRDATGAESPLPGALVHLAEGRVGLPADGDVAMTARLAEGLRQVTRLAAATPALASDT